MIFNLEGLGSHCIVLSLRKSIKRIKQKKSSCYLINYIYNAIMISVTFSPGPCSPLEAMI